MAREPMGAYDTDAQVLSLRSAMEVQLPRKSVQGVLLAGLVVAALAAAGAGPAVPTARAADACVVEQEPNDAPEQAQTLTGATCVSGTLPDGDQDIFLWELSPTDALQRWTLSLTGVPGTTTGLKILPITSDPGVTPITVGSSILELDSPVGTSGPVTHSDVFIPAGRYVVGVIRTTTPTFTTPVSTDYQFSIAPGDPLPPSGDREPNDDASHATPEHGAFSLSGDLAGSYDEYAWTLSPEDAKQIWNLELDSVVGQGNSISLERPDGTTIVTRYSEPDGKVLMPDLRLAAGRYILYLSPKSDGPYPYALSVASAQSPVGDAEPNDTPDVAIPLDPANPVARGRLFPYSDKDDYSLTVDDTLAGSLLDIRLIWRSGLERGLCLFDDKDVQLQCTSGSTSVALQDLLLPAATYTVEVTGDPSPSDEYLLRVDTTTAPAVDFETEPNDQATTASAWDSSVVMRGRAINNDADFYRVHVSGSTAQLWELDAVGPSVSVQWTQGDGTQLATSDALPGGSGALLTDLYLVPGDHWFRVTASGDYTLQLKSLGPPDPNAEREPNNDPDHAQPLAIGQTIIGRLPQASDADIYRFSLSADEHVSIRITPPADGSISYRLNDTDTQVAETQGSPAVGQQQVEDTTLLAGDYELDLYPSVVSPHPYSVSVVREDPFRRPPPWPASQPTSRRRPAPLLRTGRQDSRSQRSSASTTRATRRRTWPSTRSPATTPGRQRLARPRSA